MHGLSLRKATGIGHQNDEPSIIAIFNINYLVFLKPHSFPMFCAMFDALVKLSCRLSNLFHSVFPKNDLFD